MHPSGGSHHPPKILTQISLTNASPRWPKATKTNPYPLKQEVCPTLDRPLAPKERNDPQLVRTKVHLCLYCVYVAVCLKGTGRGEVNTSQSREHQYTKNGSTGPQKPKTASPGKTDNSLSRSTWSPVSCETEVALTAHKTTVDPALSGISSRTWHV